MNYNIFTYSVYGIIAIYIIVILGRLFHQNGRVFILSLFNDNTALADTTNNLLLVAYYLFNIGYAILQFSFWGSISDYQQMISSLTNKIGLLILLLAGLHYNNMLIIYILSKNKIKSLTLNK